MLSENGYQNVIKNVYKLSCGAPGGNSVENIDELRNYFLNFLEDLYPNIEVNRTKDIFIYDDNIELNLANAFNMKEHLGNPDQMKGFIGNAYPNPVKIKKIEQVKIALEELLDIDNELRSIFELVIHSIIVREPKTIDGRITHSSSATTAVGVIWLSIVDGLSKHDIQELLVHELIHQLLFIDDFVHSQFDYAEMSKEENFGITGISLTRRPLDIVIHSLVVAAELVMARKYLIGEPVNPKVHSRTDKITKNAITSYRYLLSLANCNKLVTPHIGKILNHSMSQIGLIKSL